jgi:hypothetical protein
MAEEIEWPDPLGMTYSAPSSAKSLNQQLLAHLFFSPILAQQDYTLAKKYTPEYAAVTRGLESEERKQVLEDISKYAPIVTSAAKKAEDPRVTALRDLLLQQVYGELSMGTQMTPEQSLEVNESIRSAQMARGLGYGQGAANRESVARAIEGLKLLESRQSKASGLITQEKSYQPDVFSIIGGIPTTATSKAVQLTAAGTQDPSLSYLGQNFWNANNAALQQALMEQDIAKYNATLQLAKQNPDLGEDDYKYLW